mmetsp:Transcript_7432/g.16230  ORF Transcript_7432/g.16230 Transcript_7432/m.16230 type:complete len:86 (+) Transcript_7432:729-986(+)
MTTTGEWRNISVQSLIFRCLNICASHRLCRWLPSAFIAIVQNLLSGGSQTRLKGSENRKEEVKMAKEVRKKALLKLLVALAMSEE